MSLCAAMSDACRAVGIVPPARALPGRWVPCPAEGKPRSNTAGRVLIARDGRSGIAWNWITGEHRRFAEEGAGPSPAAPRPSPAAERQAAAERRAEVAAICAAILRACAPARHPYLAAKGFPTEVGLVIAAPHRAVPATRTGRAVLRALPEADQPLLVVPGRIGGIVTTLQFITAEGIKKNILAGRMGGAVHRIATGRETWVCEGIATALSVRAALRLLGRSATVLCAFAAANVARVAHAMPDAIVAADNDKPIPQFEGQGAGEWFARVSGRRWIMPPERGDWNDFHQAHGLEAVAAALKGVQP